MRSICLATGVWLALLPVCTADLPEGVRRVKVLNYPPAAQVPAIELEPHGPRNIIRPGATGSFKEDWYLLAHPFPAADGELDLDKRVAQVEREAR